ncbi:hypothetical protein DL89DRAFT_316145 [Linderina pennispora]|uniref:Uncharacterized protein n=1 Tax=Linderina pennispora TaxID=61395 RepID=A0A1Y1W916_9FUNG|nr:uncharacterized protein DL89DRAFT_316145 [Linderina pennispora]ORX69895.1 hypothetical protein DL89DRAFT_316145 [Linderina pennispora]
MQSLASVGAADFRLFVLYICNSVPGHKYRTSVDNLGVHSILHDQKSAASTPVSTSGAIHTDYTRIQAMRVAATWIDFTNGNLTIWIILAPPLYQCLFHRDKYLQMWLRKLERDGLKHAYDISDKHRPNDEFYPPPPDSDMSSYQFPLRGEKLPGPQTRVATQYGDVYGLGQERTTLTLNRTVFSNSFDSLTDGGVDSPRRLV